MRASTREGDRVEGQRYREHRFRATRLHKKLAAEETLPEAKMVGITIQLYYLQLNMSSPGG